MNYYRCSNGDRISKPEIDRRVRRAKEEKLCDQLNEHGYNFCEQCINEGYSGLTFEMRILDCAHIISVDRCQKEGKSELAWDKQNIRILCRYHHKLYDKTNLSFKHDKSH